MTFSIAVKERTAAGVEHESSMNGLFLDLMLMVLWLLPMIDLFLMLGAFAMVRTSDKPLGSAVLCQQV